MDKPRSLSIKPTRFLLLSSFRISFSLIIFLIFFSIWLIKIAPSLHQQTHFLFGSGSGLEPIIIHSVATNSSSNQLKAAILIRTQFIESVNTSGFSNLSTLVEASTSTSSRTSGQNTNNGTGDNHFGTGFSEDSSVNHLIESVLIATHRRGGENSYGFGKNLISKERGIKSQVNEGIDGNLFGSLYGKSIIDVSKKDKIAKNGTSLCDFSKGKWVFDETYPLYTNASCPFIDEGFNCQSNGRLDKDYMKWRWQPQDCHIPRFNATKMLNLIRGKRLVFVGDSINRNQWESMLCLLMGAIKDPKRVYEARGRRITKEKGNYCFKFLDYKCTVEYYASHYLVHESKARVGKKRVQTLRIDTMDRGSSRWKRADILVFNTAHWWNHYKTKSGVNYYQEGEQVHPRLDVSTAFQKALMTWGSWLDKYINPSKTQVFFRTSAPSHFRGGQWNAGGHCREALRPLSETSSSSYSEKHVILEEVLRQTKTPVTLLNITSLSDYRVDGHPSVYGRQPGKKYPSGGQDCSHWCLPGVPDTWNELLYFLLQSNTRESLSR